jgi:hypothetical protein
VAYSMNKIRAVDTGFFFTLILNILQITIFTGRLMKHKDTDLPQV